MRILKGSADCRDIGADRLTTADTATPGALPVAIEFDPSGRFAYSANQDSNNLTMFNVDSQTGALTPLGNIGAGSSLFAVTVEPAGRFVYTANQASGDVSTYA
jgi:6-phosphogluconolactonase